MSIFKSTHHQILLECRCPEYCCVELGISLPYNILKFYNINISWVGIGLLGG
jgi:hypothetical protein